MNTLQKKRMHTLPEKGAFSVNEFLAWASIGRTTFYSEVSKGRIKTKKLGNKTLIQYNAAQAWLASLPEAA